MLEFSRQTKSFINVHNTFKKKAKSLVCCLILKNINLCYVFNFIPFILTRKWRQINGIKKKTLLVTDSIVSKAVIKTLMIN